MKKKTRVKGFTMVELLAVISVLAILILIAIPSFRGIYKKFSNNYYHMLEGTVKIAGNDYFTDNKKMIPELVGETSDVEVGTLIQNGYIDKEYADKDSSGNELNNLKGKNGEETCNATYALAYKKAKGKYEYHGCLVCVDKTGKQVYSSEKDGSDEYCKAAYKTDQNIIIHAPNNGLIPLPDDINQYINRITEETSSSGLPYILPPNAMTEKKSNGINKTFAKTDAKTSSISPNSYAVIVNGKQETEGTEVKQSNILDSVYDIYNKLENKGTKVTDNNNTYIAFKKWTIANKVKIKYTYEYKQSYTDVEGNTQQITKKATCIYSFSSMIDESVSIGDLSLSYKKQEIEFVDGTGGSIDKDKSLNSMSWANKDGHGGVIASFKASGNISNYYCKYGNGDWSTCTEISENERERNVQNIAYYNINNSIQVVGYTAAYNPSNILEYKIKVDTTNPELSNDLTMVNNWSNNCITQRTLASSCRYANNTWTNTVVHMSGNYVNDNWAGPSGSDELSGVNHYEILAEEDVKDENGNPIPKNTWNTYIYGAYNVDYNTLYRLIESGTFKRSIRAVDNAGNYSDVKTSTIKIDREGPTVPTSKVDNKSVSSYNSDGSIWTNKNIKWDSFSAIDTGIGVDHYEFSSGCTGTKTNNLNLSYTYPLNNQESWNGHYCIRAVDKLGNVSSWSDAYKFQVDQVKPVFHWSVKQKKNGNNLDEKSNIGNLSNYSSGTWMKGYVFVKITDVNSGPSGATVTCTDSRANAGNFSTYRNVDAEGTTTISCSVESGAGKSGNSATHVIKLDRTAPYIDGNNDYNSKSCKSFKNLDWNYIKHRLKIIVKDSDSGLKQMYYKYDYADSISDSDSGWVENTNMMGYARTNGIVLSRNGDNTPKSVRFDFNLKSTAKAVFRFKLCDKVGNCTGVSKEYTAAKVSDDTSKSSNYCRNIYPTGDDYSNSRSNYLGKCSASETLCYIAKDVK